MAISEVYSNRHLASLHIYPMSAVSKKIALFCSGTTVMSLAATFMSAGNKTCEFCILVINVVLNIFYVWKNKDLVKVFFVTPITLKAIIEWSTECWSIVQLCASH